MFVSFSFNDDLFGLILIGFLFGLADFERYAGLFGVLTFNSSDDLLLVRDFGVTEALKDVAKVFDSFFGFDSIFVETVLVGLGLVPLGILEVTWARWFLTSSFDCSISSFCLEGQF
jgi:hypothetical protein